MATKEQVTPLLAVICALYAKLSRKPDARWSLSNRFTPFVSGLAQLYHLLVFLVIYILSLAMEVVRVEDVTACLNRRVDEMIVLYDTLSTRFGELSSTAVKHEELEKFTVRLDTLQVHLDDDAKKFNAFLNMLHTLLEEQITMQTRHEKELETSTRSISLLKTELALVKLELSKLRGEQPSCEPLSSDAAREARKARILAEVARRMEEREKANAIALVDQPGNSVSTKEKERVQFETTTSGGHAAVQANDSLKPQVTITPPSPKRSPKKSGNPAPKKSLLPLRTTSANRRARLEDKSTSLNFARNVSQIDKNTATGKENCETVLPKSSASAAALGRKRVKPSAASLPVQAGNLRTSSIPKFQQSKLPAPVKRFASTGGAKESTKPNVASNVKIRGTTMLDKSSEALQEVAVPPVNSPPPSTTGTGPGSIPIPSSAGSDEDFPDDDFSILPSLGSKSHLQESSNESSEIFDFLSYLRGMVPKASVRSTATSDRPSTTKAALASTSATPTEYVTPSTSTASLGTVSASSSRADFQAEVEESQSDFSALPEGLMSSLDGKSPVVTESAGSSVAVNEEGTPCYGASPDDIQAYLRSLHTAPEVIQRRNLRRAASLIAPPMRKWTTRTI